MGFLTHLKTPALPPRFIVYLPHQSKIYEGPIYEVPITGLQSLTIFCSLRYTAVFLFPCYACKIYSRGRKPIILDAFNNSAVSGAWKNMHKRILSFRKHTLAAVYFFYVSILFQFSFLLRPVLCRRNHLQNSRREKQTIITHAISPALHNYTLNWLTLKLSAHHCHPILIKPKH